ncbi:MAG: S-methyl-5-thioribose-1-phosphate isomerase [Paracoccaceae bacterium]|jgi:methylthioribose-1-phosphate isomerase|nr:S-methyl-5-thioribose-1-phosphate isomerase [Rhodobacterales bacterium]NCX27921.1 S-methyl-5-thioribose-1-phosphate isomerase [Rhodobacterales bacterium]NCX53445.1 S-methyl-5-thioribose-1-phosphate isomerase [Rhodobacterales bacterium]NCX85975.1 S-methyl-5-thioribose-1-phosphate isomerase [Paracoccaceae bacterium]NDA29161.1 S-methyl-5-thioribose-1-phosphate isomerase [Alphaproteobacteria bacterium]
MKVQGTHYRSIWYDYKDCQVKIIDQRWLPHDFRIVALTNLNEFAVAIRDMWVRGAPLIGATAAYGVAISLSDDASDSALKNTYDTLIKTRPTAINLKWALDRLLGALTPVSEDERPLKALELAHLVAEEDVGINKKIGEHGLEIVKKIASKKPAGEPVRMLTHCNAGWPATVDWGTATSPMYHAHEAGIPIHVWVDETRPRNQGAMTAWELESHGISNTYITDNAGGHLMQRGLVDMVIVGTDRTTAQGDVCNKIGTYLKALAAHDNGVPFYVALPSPTIDWTISDGVADIPIEERASREVTHIFGHHEKNSIEEIRVTSEGVSGGNPAFDVTPNRLVTGLITERGVSDASEKALANMFPDLAGL